ncbi:uncharacterized protein VTP21DRAFT_10923 [Calcarisporiella thermophila]|uniref:uncharacterized protein n=1 Tax=Calcarisporiella thermophila TaxID=911321 RepID=UPI0037449ADA
MLKTASRSVFKATSSAVRPLTVVRTKVTLPDLPYDYAELQPYISAEIMELHHSKHHAAYVAGYNTAAEKLEAAVANQDVLAQISLQSALKFNGGGHTNHSLFWKNLAPPKKGGGEPPKGALLTAIQEQFGSLDAFISQFNTTTAAVQGSGWGWLGFNKQAKRLEIATTPNQDPLIHLVPLLGVDVWEHAYYLDYKNKRPDYLKAIWNVVNWKTVAERYASAQGN